MEKNCSYSIHVVCSHLLTIRGNQPLTFNSAFKFESFYAEMRNCFQPGTTSTLKQILQNVIMKRTVEHHVCLKSMFFQAEKRHDQNKVPRECNSIVYTFENETYNFYKIISIEDDVFICLKYGTYQCVFPVMPTLNWSNVGVFRCGPIDSRPFTIPLSTICGKAIKVDKYIISCPFNVLREQ